MKKVIGITLSLIGIIMVAISLVLKIKSLSVIGGADGPTSIFIAGKVGDASLPRSSPLPDGAVFSSHSCMCFQMKDRLTC